MRALAWGGRCAGRCAGRQDKVFYTSPTVRYAGLRFYATPTPYKDSAGCSMLGQVNVLADKGGGGVRFGKLTMVRGVVGLEFGSGWDRFGL